MGTIEHWTLYPRGSSGGPLSGDAEERLIAVGPDLRCGEPIGVVPASQLEGAVEALRQIAEGAYAGPHESAQTVARRTLDTIGGQ